MVNYYYKILITLVLFFPLIKAKIEINSLEKHKVLQEYTQLAAYMTTRFISPKTNTLIIFEQCDVICSQFHNYHSALLQNYLYKLNATLSVQMFAGRYGDKPWNYNLFIVDSFTAFEWLRYSLPTTDQERLFYFFIILTWSPDPQSQFQAMHDIFALCFKFNVRYVVIMFKSLTYHTIHFYTYDIFTADHCQEKITIREINRFENGVLSEDLLFPKRVLNYFGCTLNVTAHIAEPLLSFDGDMDNPEHLMDMHRLGGIEGDILNVLADILNFKFRVRFSRKENMIRYYGRSSGCFGDLEQGLANLAIGGLSSVIYNANQFTSTFVYYTTPLVFVVRSGVYFGPLKQLLNPFELKTWILILLSFVLAVIFTKMAKHYRKPVMRDFVFGTQNKYPIRYLCGMFLGNPLPTHMSPKRNFARFLLMSGLLLTFEIRNGYQGKMYDSLRHAKPITIPGSISQLYDWNYTLYSATYTDFYPSNKTVIMRNSTARFELIQTSKTKIATVALLDYLAYYNSQNWNSSSLTYVKEAVYSYPCAIFFLKHSMLQSNFDQRLKILSDAGITSHIAKQQVRTYFRNMITQTEYEVELANRNLMGLYFIYIMMCILAIVIFAAELLSRKSKTLRNITDWLNSM